MSSEHLQRPPTVMPLIAELIALELIKLEDKRLRRMRFWELLQDVGKRVERLEREKDNLRRQVEDERRKRRFRRGDDE